MNNELVVIRGAPGSGKSTYAKKFIDLGYSHYEADMYFVDEKDNYNFDKTKLYLAHRWCQEKVCQTLQRGENVVVSNTSTTLKEVQTYIDIAKYCNVPVRVIRMTGDYGNIHGVPEETLKKMKERFQDYPGEELIK